jgi:hypothetical protein
MSLLVDEVGFGVAVAVGVVVGVAVGLVVAFTVGPKVGASVTPGGAFPVSASQIGTRRKMLCAKHVLE